MKKKLILILFLILTTKLFAITPLIIYRPENDHPMNEVRCYIKILDENNNDVTYSCGNAFYSWANIPGRYHAYKKKYFLSGGMAFHINIMPGKYKISVYTPKDEHYEIDSENKETWNSNTFEYDSDNPINVIFVAPTVNQNQFYNGGWTIHYRAPKFYKYTKPYPPELLPKKDEENKEENNK